ncbi:MAG: hypothetical protein Q7I89_07470 [Syntrophales bacterium]|nr:hypothetical protein [Syntrophales bacterium]
MNLETFFEKFDQFAEAPNAVAKLRELLLQLAVQGKLVGREAREGDGHSLLKRLRKLPPEKNSKSRVPRDLPAEPEIEVEVPIHWAIVVDVCILRPNHVSGGKEWKRRTVFLSVNQATYPFRQLPEPM